MASEDVIELGSSDDEPEPPKKKIKPLPNAMVHIPHKLPGVTIKPAKPKSATQTKASARKSVTVTKVMNTASTANANRNKFTSIPIQKFPGKPNVKGPMKNIPIHTRAINPLSIMKKFNNSQVLVNKIPSTVQLVKNPIKIQTQKSLNNLPPSITVTRTAPSTKGRIAVASVSNIIKRKQQELNQRNAVGEVLTVELDDDETSASSTASPQWYLRPEEQTEETFLQEKNNEEPQPTNLIEITIEDSPVKPAHNKQIHDIGSELAITIEDSPLKSVKDGENGGTVSDEERTNDNKVLHSKKRLEYPIETKTVGATVEIEIEPMSIDVTNSSVNIEASDSVNKKVNEESELQTNKVESPDVCTLKKDNQSSLQSQSTKEIGTEIITEKGEFHPIYQNFIDLCFKLENSDDMKKIVEKKIKAYYRQVPKEYTESEEFIDMVSSKIQAIRSSPDKMYLYIKDIVDELNLQRKLTKSQIVNEENHSKESGKNVSTEGNEFDSKRRRQIHKLEKTIKKLHRAIQKLEEQEVDFDDEDDSVYLLTERYKERMVRVHAKFCQLTNTKMPSEPHVHIEARSGQPNGPAKRVEKLINKKVMIGKPLPFPDFHDVLHCVREANEEDKLGWNEAEIMDEARDLFTRCGRKLQRRRQENEWRSAASRISLERDPAEENEELKKKLEENKMIAAKKEIELLNKYADRQKQLKLEAEEIGDKEAEESPVESEDDEVNDEGTNLQNKEKRKECLKKLLQGKAKKTVLLDKENQPTNLSDKSQSSVEMISEEIKENSNSVQETNMDKKQSQDIKLKMNSVSKNDIPVAEEKEEGSDKSEKNNHDTDDSNKVDSDVDVLHLFKKLHSENEVNSSTLQSSDSDAYVITSDTLESQSDVEKKLKASSDVISIENSSYSDTETIKGKANETDDMSVNETFEVDDHLESDYSNTSTKMRSNVNTNESIENILLASSEDETGENLNVNRVTDNVCTNLRDDTISVDDTSSQDLKSVEDVEIKVLNVFTMVEKEEKCEKVKSSCNENTHSLKTGEELSTIIENLEDRKESVQSMGSTELEKNTYSEKCDSKNIVQVSSLQQNTEIIDSSQNKISSDSINHLSNSDSNEKH